MVQLQSYIQALWSGHSQALTAAGSPATLPGSLGCRQGGTAAPCVLPASHRPTGAARPPGSPLPLLLQHREVTHVLGNGKPTAPSRQRSCRAPPGLCPQQPGERASALATRRGLQNPSNIPAFLPPKLQTLCCSAFDFHLHPALPRMAVSAASPTCAVPALGVRALRDHRGVCADSRVCFANTTLSDISGSPEQRALREIPEGPLASDGSRGAIRPAGIPGAATCSACSPRPRQEQVCFLQRSKSWEQLAATHTGGRKL